MSSWLPNACLLVWIWKSYSIVALQFSITLGGVSVHTWHKCFCTLFQLLGFGVPCTLSVQSLYILDLEWNPSGIVRSFPVLMSVHLSHSLARLTYQYLVTVDWRSICVDGLDFVQTIRLTLRDVYVVGLFPWVLIMVVIYLPFICNKPSDSSTPSTVITLLDTFQSHYFTLTYLFIYLVCPIFSTFYNCTLLYYIFFFFTCLCYD